MKNNTKPITIATIFFILLFSVLIAGCKSTPETVDKKSDDGFERRENTGRVVFNRYERPADEYFEETEVSEESGISEETDDSAGTVVSEEADDGAGTEISEGIDDSGETESSAVAAAESSADAATETSVAEETDKETEVAQETEAPSEKESPVETLSLIETDKFITGCFAGTSNIFILPSDGTFWSAGYNHSGQLGLENDLSYIVWDISQVFINGEEYPDIVSVAPGENHTVVLMEDGSLWGVGESLYGELGRFGSDGIGKVRAFTRLKNMNGNNIDSAKVIAAGCNNTFYIDNDNALWATGFNYYGELGLGNTTNSPGFVKVPGAGIGDVKSVAAGSRHTVILKNDGSVWVSGYNFNGQLGLGDEGDVSSFTLVKDIDSAAAVAAGNYHTVILKDDGTVWTAGANYSGQLGYDGEGQRSFTQVKDSQGKPVEDAVAIAAKGDMTIIQKNDGSLLLAGSYLEPEYDYESGPPEQLTGEPESTLISIKPADPSAFTGIDKVVLGSRSIYVLTEDGHVWAAGSNWYGQLIMPQDVIESDVLKWIFPQI